MLWTQREHIWNRTTSYQHAGNTGRAGWQWLLDVGPRTPHSALQATRLSCQCNIRDGMRHHQSLWLTYYWFPYGKTEYGFEFQVLSIKGISIHRLLCALHWLCQPSGARMNIVQKVREKRPW